MARSLVDYVISTESSLSTKPTRKMTITITTTDQIRSYLLTNSIPFNTITSLPGGSGNFVWRITNPPAPDIIIKHAEPFVKNHPIVPFSVERMSFEAQALTTIPTLVPTDSSIRLPVVLHHDPDTHTLALTDVGDTTLPALYPDPRLDIPSVGARIGRYIARLHAASTSDAVKRPFDNATAKFMYRYNYNNLHNALASQGLDPTLGLRINARYGALLQTDTKCVCHGDLWPGNILFRAADLDELSDAAADGVTIGIIDWEAARMGNGVTDVGQFAAEAWLLDEFRGGRGLQNAFLEAYVREKGSLEKGDVVRIAVHFGMHVTFWPTIYVSLSCVPLHLELKN
jgi:5-methylthioribose kinase